MKINKLKINLICIIMMFFSGNLYLWSVFNEPVSILLKWNKQSASYTSSILISSFVLGIFICSVFVGKIKESIFILLGGMMIGIGIASTGLVTSKIPWLVYVTYGLISGIGSGFIYISSLSLLQKNRSAGFSSVAPTQMAAFGLSPAVLAPIYKYLIEIIGLSKTFIATGLFMVFVYAVCAYQILRIERFLPSVNIIGAASKSGKKQYKPIEMINTGNFKLMAASIVLLTPVFFVICPTVIDIAKNKGLDDGDALICVVAIGLGSCVSRIILSIIPNHVRRKYSMQILSFIMFSSALLALLSTGSTFIFAVFVISFAFGGIMVVYAANISAIYGTENFLINFSCIMLFFGLSALISPLISGLFSFGNMKISLIIAAIASLASFVLVSFTRPSLYSIRD